MFREELERQRAVKWRTDGANRVRALDDARAFLDQVGFCLEYPTRPAVVAPTFIGAVLGTAEDLPLGSKALVDPRAVQARELIERLLEAKVAFEVPLGDVGTLLVSAAEFPYFYSLLGERNPKSIPGEGIHGERRLAADTFRLLAKQPLTEQEMLAAHGKGISEAALTRTLHGLWAKLRIARIEWLDRRAESPKWDVLYRIASQQVGRGAHLSQAEALSALVSRYLETVIAAEAKEIEDFFGHIASRAKTAEILKALSSARELETRIIGRASMLALPSRGEEKNELGTAQQRSLGGERRTAPDIGRNMVLRHDRRGPQREDRRGPRHGRREERKPRR